MSAENPILFHTSKTPVDMGDGRTLTYYDFAAQNSAPPYLATHQEAAATHPAPGPRVLPHPSEMRWNPTLAEWTVCSAHRMTRPMLPSRESCPLCPGVLELPLPYQVAIFENRAPGLSYVPGDLELPSTQGVVDATATARGRCDIVVYSQKHDSKLAELPVNDIYCLIEAWRDRYADLVALPEIRCVSIFENKGREAGMTLDHPHGQIYSFPFLPPVAQRQWEQTLAFEQSGAGNLWDKVLEKEERDAERIIAQSDGFVAAQPFYARYPYEVHIWARRVGVSSLLEMTPGERRELAGLMKNITARYENLWPGSTYGFPTLMMMHQLTRVDGAHKFRFHIEWYPLQRSPDKLKYRASVETGAGTFLNDALPEKQAAELRASAPQDIEMPDILFD